MRFSFLVFFGFLATEMACGSTVEVGAVDGGPSESGSKQDGATDGGAMDEGVQDEGVHDGGLRDGGVHDGGIHDGGVQDGDAGDGGIKDGGPMDGGATEYCVGACCWPETLQPPDSGMMLFTGDYWAYRWFLWCTFDSGAGGGCYSDSTTEPTSCPGLSGATCASRCNAGEYFVLLEDVADDPPFPSCTAHGTDPDQSFFCCPCGAGTDGG
jgi:hypothetical protein